MQLISLFILFIFIISILFKRTEQTTYDLIREDDDNDYLHLFSQLKQTTIAKAFPYTSGYKQPEFGNSREQVDSFDTASKE
jgi:hypothetical protein